MALRQGLNRVYDVEETRPYPVQVLLAIGYTAALLVMFALMLFLVFVGPVSTYLTEVLPEFITKPITIEMHDQVLITLLMLVIFVMVYTFIPSGKRSFLRQIPGALLDAVVWIIFSELFSIYVEGNNAYSMFYGSLGGIAILLFWLYKGRKNNILILDDAKNCRSGKAFRERQFLVFCRTSLLLIILPRR